VIARTARLEPSKPLVVEGVTLDGEVLIQRLTEDLETEKLYLNVVLFDTGVRTPPHSHGSEQVLYFQRGAGVIAFEGGEDQRIEEGEAVLLPAGIVHLHGATDEGPAWAISMMPGR
jgi:quercetin dioxygenase-like cupin family protein